MNKTCLKRKKESKRDKRKNTITPFNSTRNKSFYYLYTSGPRANESRKKTRFAGNVTKAKKKGY